MSVVNQVICIYIKSPTYNTMCHGENTVLKQYTRPIERTKRNAHECTRLYT